MEVAGGADNFRIPTHHKFAAIAAFYPWCGNVRNPIDTPLIVLAAGKDDWTPPEQCEYYAGKMKGAEYKVVIYPDSHHGFDLGNRMQYFAGHTVGGNNTEVTSAARTEMLSFFEKYRK